MLPLALVVSDWGKLQEDRANFGIACANLPNLSVGIQNA